MSAILNMMKYAKFLGFGNSANSGGGDTGWVVCEETEPTKETTIDELQGLRLSLPNATEIAKSAFHGCANLISVDIPSATKIGEDALNGCTNLTTVDLPAATEVYGSAFYGCTSLTTVDLPAATKIGLGAFYGCTSLTSVDLPSATSIDDNAFYGCTSLTSVDLPVATTIGYCAFSGCTSLTSVDLPSVTVISSHAFNGCTNLTTVDLPSVTAIGENAFMYCTNLTTVDLPSATEIDDAFYGCLNLSALILRNTDAVCQLNVLAVQGTKIATEEGAPTGEGFIYVPSALYEGYVTLIAQQTAMLLMSQGMGEAEAQATADYIARAVLRKIEDYPEICG